MVTAMLAWGLRDLVGTMRGEGGNKSFRCGGGVGPQKIPARVQAEDEKKRPVRAEVGVFWGGGETCREH